MSKHNLAEFKFAKDVVEEFPIILARLNQLEKDLKPHEKFACVGYVMQAVHDSKEMLTRQYVHYRGVLDKKGKE